MYQFQLGSDAQTYDLYVEVCADGTLRFHDNWQLATCYATRDEVRRAIDRTPAVRAGGCMRVFELADKPNPDYGGWPDTITSWGVDFFPVGG